MSQKEETLSQTWHKCYTVWSELMVLYEEAIMRGDKPSGWLEKLCHGYVRLKIALRPKPVRVITNEEILDAFIEAQIAINLANRVLDEATKERHERMYAEWLDKYS